MRTVWLLFKCFFLSTATVELNRNRKEVPSVNFEFNITCYSFFGEFRKNGSFQLTEALNIVVCNQRIRHCFVEVSSFYRLAHNTWFNGQCDDSFACIHESEYGFSNGCQATLHGGDRCCCSNKLCNFGIILKERPYFVKYLPKQRARKSDSISLKSHCGKVKPKSNYYSKH